MWVIRLTDSDLRLVASSSLGLKGSPIVHSRKVIRCGLIWPGIGAIRARRALRAFFISAYSLDMVRECRLEELTMPFSGSSRFCPAPGVRGRSKGLHLGRRHVATPLSAPSQLATLIQF